MHVSLAFGLRLLVEPPLEIPGLLASGAACATSEPTTLMRLDPDELERRWQPGSGEARRVREQRQGGRLALSVEHVLSAGYLLRAPGYARILVASDGGEVLCDPEPDNPHWSAIVSAQALPLAATLRGLELLHASGVVVGDGVLGGGAVLFAGPQGAGKSSLAGALVRRGAALLSDDTVALEPRGGSLIAHPGTALLHLRADEHERLSTAERSALGPTAPALGKQRCTLHAMASPAPLGALFMLERSRMSNGSPVERIETVDPFVLLASTFNLSVRTPERLTRHLDLAASLAASGRIYRLQVRRGVDATQLADTLLERLPEL